MSGDILRFDLGTMKKARGREEKYVPILDCYIHDVYYIVRTLNTPVCFVLKYPNMCVCLFNEKYVV